MYHVLAALAALSALACAAPIVTPDAAPDAPADAGTPPPSTLGPSERPARLFVPDAHDGATELPLLLLLHGYTVDSMLQDLYLGVTRGARTGGFYVLLPDGTFDADRNRHWDVVGAVVDDHAYLRALVEETASLVPVAPGEIYVLGHSNGGFMAYRLACDSADLIAGIASLAGADALTDCAPARPVAVLQIHGTADDTVLYGGGSIIGLDYPAAPTVVERWAERSGCDAGAPEELAPVDLIESLDGAETGVTSYRTGCEAHAELWTMEGAGHIPPVGRDFTPAVMAWLRARAR